MKKIKKRKQITVTESFIPLEDAEKCPVCNFPFPASVQFINKRIFMCFICDKGFEKVDNIFKDITKGPPE